LLFCWERGRLARQRKTKKFNENRRRARRPRSSRSDKHKVKEIITRQISKMSAQLIGDHRRFPLEHRLFNTTSLLNTVTNLGGAIHLLILGKSKFLLFLHLITGFLFFLFYYVARFRRSYRFLYYPFVLSIVVFLFINALGNAGSLGGTIFYFIPALVIAIILSEKKRATVFALLIFGVATSGLLLLEYNRPEWITYYFSSHERFFDVTSNLLFAQLFTGVLVMVLSQALNQERQESDNLLLNILPASVAKELKEMERVNPVDYKSASVLFTDFVGFTRIAEGFTPQQLIEELDNCFRRFDVIAKKHNLEKIKTIGDAYMAVGGIPVSNNTHAADCVRAALEIEKFMADLMRERAAVNRPFWQIRIGVHTGDLIAGVIGREKFSYDVWGDTVNTASRMESSGEAGRVNISQATYELVKDYFDCEYRGRIKAKNKGEIEMYFVNGVKESTPIMKMENEAHITHNTTKKAQIV